jgi:large subunit ribosomal protein L9
MMEVILLEKVENLGTIGDRVKVRAGYGRNYLLPQGKATMATAENIEKFEAIRAELEAKSAEELTRAQGRAKLLEGLSVKLNAKAGTEGKLFGSIGPVDIAEALTAQGVEIERREVRMADGPIRLVGNHEVEVHLHADVSVTIPVEITGEE